MLYITAMLLAVLSTVLYHLITRAIPGQIYPLVTVTITYLTAAAICMIMLPFLQSGEAIRVSLSNVNWSSFALAFAITGIELGFLLAYRAGWNISLAAIVANVATTLVLLPVGVVAFKEHLTTGQIIGMILCLIGLVLINRR